MSSHELNARERLYYSFLIMGLGTLALAGCGGHSENNAAATRQAYEATATNKTFISYPTPGPRVLLPGSVHVEIVQASTLSTFVDFRDASGTGPTLPAGTKLIVDCVASGPIGAAPSAEDPQTKTDEWYHITEEVSPNAVIDRAPAGFYAAANAFDNTTDPAVLARPLSEQPPVDQAVPVCP